jgi:hypothetical protein
MTVTRYFRREGRTLLVASEGLALRISGDLADSLLAHIDAGDDAQIDKVRELLGAGYVPSEVRWTELLHLRGQSGQP